jgi:chromate reductase, NAD(P)H dehydrogenase (quinone)
MRVLGISGSLRRGSFNGALLRQAGDLFMAEDAEFEIYEGLRDLPAYDEDADLRKAPAAVVRIRAAVREVDAVLFATPEYNSSIPGALKNAIDWLSRPSLAESALRGKPVAVVGASTGAFGAVWAQAELRKVLASTGARVIEGEVTVGHAMDRFGGDGRLDDENLEEQLREVVDVLLREAEIAQERSPPDRRLA